MRRFLSAIMTLTRSRRFKDDRGSNGDCGGIARVEIPEGASATAATSRTPPSAEPDIARTRERKACESDPVLDEITVASACQPHAASRNRPIIDGRQTRLLGRTRGNPGVTGVGLDIMDEPPRRNPKRKATEPVTSHLQMVDDLLREAVAPVTTNDIREWTGWCELESEPAFFNVILRDYGVKDVKIQEVFSIDDDFLRLLPQPVYGLIFLYQYFSEDYEAEEPSEDSQVWFANQTTDNACATVAMMNIIMNSEVEIGAELEAFKETTKDMSYPLRGQALSMNDHLRTIHNSLTRRLDHLNADLFLSGEVDRFDKNKKKRKASGSTSTGKKKKPHGQAKKKRKKINPDIAFHFVAIVPAAGSVWELDGLKSGPVNLGSVEADANWVDVAKPFIEARMLQFEEGAVYFNVMALCRSPLATASTALAKTVRQLSLLSQRAEGNSEFSSLAANAPPPFVADEEGLHAFGLTSKVVEEAEVEPEFASRIKDVADAAELFTVYEELVTAQKMAMGEYKNEQAAMYTDEHRLRGRKMDNMAAIHRWLEAIAGHGKLEEMARDTQ
ncbi:cysteine proteinase [Sodiomyces alkalinus F11]|uniref:Ubiquitin carboxyl-terminal hydrolase n=1 Tax=Sodiomyces alkalinus (strain CBS 110278 / VKM F-3762 / F11) TaxID=1314773 RepID=A0A3N2Q7J0_SODAK|nr:cysteine proteinase [Sodiomyces alkalinus F11]ROT42734.1 cysteine proteinase [Sodiomyces alkalinus F11]